MSCNGDYVFALIFPVHHAGQLLNYNSEQGHGMDQGKNITSIARQDKPLTEIKAVDFRNPEFILSCMLNDSISCQSNIREVLLAG